MNKITKIWFDEALDDFVQQDITPTDWWRAPVAGEAPTRYVLDDRWKADLDSGVARHLSREQLLNRFWSQMPKNTASRILGIDPASPGSDRTVVWHGGQQVGKSLALADIQRTIDSIKAAPAHQPRYLSADLYDRMQAEGMALGGVTRLDPPPRYTVRPPKSEEKCAALHPLLRRLIDQLNKEN